MAGRMRYDENREADVEDFQAKKLVFFDLRGLRRELPTLSLLDDWLHSSGADLIV
jgi:hypothetical protein